MTAAPLRLLGRLDTSALKESIEIVLQRHESLRTRFVSVDGAPRQQIDPPRGYTLEITDLARVPSGNVETEARRVAQQFQREAIDLSVGPIFDTKLLRLSTDDHVLLLGLDHIMADAVSCVVLNREIWSVYHTLLQGLPSTLPPLAVQFADYAIWQQKVYELWRKEHEGYWRKRLEGAPHLRLPANESAASSNPSTWRTVHVPLSRSLSERLHAISQRERVLLPLLVLTMYASAVSRWCHQEDLVISFVSHGRHGRPELESMIGLLANVLHLRLRIAQEDHFRDILKRVNVEFYSAFGRQDFGWLPDLIPNCPGEPFFNWMPSNWTRRTADPCSDSDSRLKIQLFPVPIVPAVVDGESGFRATAYDSPAGIIVTLWYRPDAVAATSMHRLASSLRKLAGEIVEKSNWSVASKP